MNNRLVRMKREMRLRRRENKSDGIAVRRALEDPTPPIPFRALILELGLKG